MKSVTILKFRNLYSSIFTFVRKKHVKKFVYRQKKMNCTTNILTKDQKREAKKYYSGYKNISTVYHNFYTEKTGVFHQEYIPDDLYFNDINYYFNDYHAFKIIDNKTNYDKLFPSIHQPKILAARKNAFWYIDDKIVSVDEVKNVLEKETAVFIKRAMDCGGASGVYCLDVNSSANWYIEFLKIVKLIPTDIAIQKLVIQHNFCSGGVAVGIDESSGLLRKYGYYLNGDRITHHPITKVEFNGIKIPSFEQAKELCKRAHVFVPHFRMVSWDVAIESDGNPILIEANLADGQLDFHQLTNGPLFGADTIKILDEVYSRP